MKLQKLAKAFKDDVNIAHNVTGSAEQGPSH